MKYKQLFIGMAIGLLAGMLLGVSRPNRYVITPSTGGALKFKLDTVTGRTWCYDPPTGFWLKNDDRKSRPPAPIEPPIEPWKVFQKD